MFTPGALFSINRGASVELNGASSFNINSPTGTTESAGSNLTTSLGLFVDYLAVGSGVILECSLGSESLVARLNSGLPGSPCRSDGRKMEGIRLRLRPELMTVFTTVYPIVTPVLVAGIHEPRTVALATKNLSLQSQGFRSPRLDGKRGAAIEVSTET